MDCYKRITQFGRSKPVNLEYIRQLLFQARQCYLRPHTWRLYANDDVLNSPFVGAVCVGNDGCEGGAGQHRLPPP
jgi:hypothetical protein